MRWSLAPFLLSTLLFFGIPPVPAFGGDDLVERMQALMSMTRLGALVEEAESAMDRRDFSAAAEHLGAALALIDEVDGLGIPDVFNGNGPSIRATILSYVGVVAIERGDFPSAAAALRASRDLFERQGMDAERMIVTNQLGIALERIGAYDEAQRLLDDAYRYYEKLDDMDGAGSALMNLCALHMSTGELGRARDACAQGSELKLTHGTPEEAALSLSMRARVLAELGYKDEARDTNRRALAANRRHSDPAVAATVHANAGLTYADTAAYQGALTYLLNAAEVFAQMGADGRLARVLCATARVHRRLGQLPQAEAAVGEALELVQSLDDPIAEIDVRNELGAASLFRGRWAEAEAELRRAETIARGLGIKLGLANALNGQGQAAMQQGRFHAARDLFEEAWALGEESGYKCPECEARGNLGTLYVLQGEYRQALRYFESRLDWLARAGFRNAELGARLDLANLYRELGLHASAIEMAESARAVAEAEESINDRDLAEALVVLARSRAAQPSGAAQALADLQSAAAVFRSLDDAGGVAEAALVQAGLEYRLGRSDQARATLAVALAAAQRADSPGLEGWALIDLALLDRQAGEHALAEWRCEHAEELLGRTEGRHSWRALLCRAEALAALGASGSAIELFEQAIERLEQMRMGTGIGEARQSFLWDKTAVYDGYIRLLARLHSCDPTQGYAARALEVFEQRQARAFLQDVGESGARRFAGVPGALIADLEDAQIALALLEREIDEEGLKPKPERADGGLPLLRERRRMLVQRIRDLSGRIRRDHPRLADLKFPRHLTAVELRDSLSEERDLALVYLVTDKFSLVWGVSTRGITIADLGIGRDALGALVSQMRGELVRGGATRGILVAEDQDEASVRPDEASPSRVLYRTLVPGPIAEVLGDADRVFIIPSEALYELPFEALITQTRAGSDRPRFLVEDLEVAYLSSLSMLAPLRQTVRGTELPDGRLLAFADPELAMTPGGTRRFEPQPNDPITTPAAEWIAGLAPLPETRDEVQAIANLVSQESGDVLLLTGAEASRNRVLELDAAGRLDDYRYVVFATHGLLPGEVDPRQQAALVLTPPTVQGLLTMSDVHGLSINARLVVLSACNTAGGEARAGEGIVGLTRAFMFAGTPSVAVTLWRVDNRSAVELDVGLFRHLSQGMRPSAALREAKLDLLRGESGNDFTAPYHWAPFVLFGDGG